MRFFGSEENSHQPKIALGEYREGSIRKCFGRSQFQNLSCHIPVTKHETTVIFEWNSFSEYFFFKYAPKEHAS